MDDAVQVYQPQWDQLTEDDFMNKDIYEWIYSIKDTFFQQQMMAKAEQRVNQIGFKRFAKMWRSFVASKKNSMPNIPGQNSTAFPDQPVQLFCGDYSCDDTGIHSFDRMGNTIKVCSHPILPIKRIIDIDSNAEKLEIAYSRGGKWRDIIVSRENLASAQKIIQLARNGIAVNSENAKDMVKYITDIESMNYENLNTQKSTEHLGWLPDGQFAPFCKELVYGGESAEFGRIYDSFTPTGSIDTWMELVKGVRTGRSVPARIALAASFAAPLVSICGALPFFVHLWGTQGCGKTVGLMLAASVWGNPDIGAGYIKSFGGTKVSQELYAAFCGNVPVLLDELQVISDRKMFDDIIYMLCEGMSKGRGAKEGGLQLQRRWSTCMITTGEMPIVQSNSGGGAAVRTIEVNYGGEPLFEDARAVANALKENYGFAGRVFVESLKDPDVVAAMKVQQKKFYSKLSGDIQDKQVLSASILLAADKLAEALIFHDGKNLTVDEIKPYLVTQKEADINYRCYQWMLGYFAANLRRFDSDDMNGGEIWGTKKDNIIFVIKPIFERILRAEGYSPGAFLTWARRNRKILCDDYGEGSGNRRLTKRVTVGGRSTPCVAIIDNDEEEEAKEIEKEEYEKYVQVDDADMPF